MSDLWKPATGPSAGLVQQHYVAARQEDLQRRNPELEQKVAKVLTDHPAFSSLRLAKTGKWVDVYRKINEKLKGAELTINFNPDTWFSTENTYDTYMQTYERGATADRNVIWTDPFNPASYRAKVDDDITLPASWSAAPGANQVPKRGSVPGLAPGVRAGLDIAKRMAFGGQKKVEPDAAHAKGGVESLNPYFDPKTKQVFAALNYARRPSGSTIYYGMGHLVLKDRLKINALYYPNDTFLIADKGTTTQVSYGMLAAVLGNAHLRLVDDLIQSCYFGVSQKDTKSEIQLLEAHLFEELRYRDGLSAVCIPLSYKGSVVEKNARKFTEKHGASFRWVLV